MRVIPILSEMRKRNDRQCCIVRVLVSTIICLVHIGITNGQTVVGEFGMRFMINEDGKIEMWGKPDKRATKNCETNSTPCFTFPDLTDTDISVDLGLTDFGCVYLTAGGTLKLAPFRGQSIWGDEPKMIDAFEEGLEGLRHIKEFTCNSYCCIARSADNNFHWISIRIDNEDGVLPAVGSLNAITEGLETKVFLTDEELYVHNGSGELLGYQIDFNASEGAIGEFFDSDGILGSYIRTGVDEFFLDQGPRGLHIVKRDTYNKHKFEIAIPVDLEHLYSALDDDMFPLFLERKEVFEHILDELNPSVILLGANHFDHGFHFNIESLASSPLEAFVLLDDGVYLISVKGSKDYTYEKRASASTRFDFLTSESKWCYELRSSEGSTRTESIDEDDKFYCFWVDIEKLEFWWNPILQGDIVTLGTSESGVFEGVELGWVDPGQNEQETEWAWGVDKNKGRFDPHLYAVDAAGYVYYGPVILKTEPDLLLYREMTEAGVEIETEFSAYDGMYTGFSGDVRCGPLVKPSDWRATPIRAGSTMTERDRQWFFVEREFWGADIQLTASSGGTWNLNVNISGVEVPFTFDTGCAITCVTQEYAEQLYESGAFSDENFVGFIETIDAGGNTDVQPVFEIGELVLGEIVVQDVLVGINGSAGAISCLLGNSFLEKVSSFTFNSNEGILRLYNE